MAMAEFKDMVSDYIENWYSFVTLRTKTIFVQAGEEEKARLVKESSQKQLKLRELEHQLLKSQFHIAVPHSNFIESILEDFVKADQHSRSEAIATKKGPVYEKLSLLNSLFKFLRLKKQKIIELNVMSNVFLNNKDRPAFSAFLKGASKSHRKPKQDEINKLLAELRFTLDQETLVANDFPVAYEHNRQIYFMLSKDYSKLKGIEEKTSSLINSIQEQIALAKVGQCDKERYESLQKQYIELKEEKDKLLSGFEPYIPQKQQADAR